MIGYLLSFNWFECVRGELKKYVSQKRVKDKFLFLFTTPRLSRVFYTLSQEKWQVLIRFRALLSEYYCCHEYSLIYDMKPIIYVFAEILSVTRDTVLRSVELSLLCDIGIFLKKSDIVRSNFIIFRGSILSRQRAVQYTA